MSHFEWENIGLTAVNLHRFPTSTLAILVGVFKNLFTSKMGNVLRYTSHKLSADSYSHVAHTRCLQGQEQPGPVGLAQPRKRV